jgi:hypothetical protein
MIWYSSSRMVSVVQGPTAVVIYSLIFAVLRIKPRASHKIGKYLTTEIHPQTLLLLLVKNRVRGVWDVGFMCVPSLKF